MTRQGCNSLTATFVALLTPSKSGSKGQAVNEVAVILVGIMVMLLSESSSSSPPGDGYSLTRPTAHPSLSAPKSALSPFQHDSQLGSKTNTLARVSQEDIDTRLPGGAALMIGHSSQTAVSKAIREILIAVAW